MRLTLIILIASLLLLTSCKNTSDPVETNQQLSKEQADQLYASNQYILVQVINFLSIQAKTAASGDVSNLPVGFGGSLVFKPIVKETPYNIADSAGFGYAGDGCWTFNYLFDTPGSSYGFDAEVCFDVFGDNGLPTAATSTATIMIDLTSSSSYSSEGYSSSSNLTELENLTVNGIAGFIMGTGNLTVNGTESVESSYSYSYDNETSSTNFDFNFTVTNFELSPQIIYPANGTITFTIITEDTSPGEENFGYNIPGMVTFNGTNMVSVKFAGFDYQLNLDLFL